MPLIIIFLIFRIVSNSLSSVFQKKLSLNYSSNFINFLSYLILSFLCLIEFKNFNFQNNFLFYAILIGFVGAIGNAFQIKALRCGELSVVAPLNSYKVIFSLFFAFIFLKELPSITALIGIILIIIGTYFICISKDEKISFNLFKRKDVLFRLLAVFFMALEAVFIKKLVLCTNSITALFLWALFSSMFSLIFFVFNKQNSFKKINFEFIKYIFFLSITMGIMQYSTNVLFKNMNVSYALCLFQLSSLLNVFLGYKIFLEKDLARKISATILMIIGASVIIVFK